MTSPRHVYPRCHVVRVIDGDTVDVDIDMGMYIHHHPRLRLADIDAPKMSGETREAGEDAAAWLEVMTGKRPIQVETIKDKKGKDKKGKYGRYLAILRVYDSEGNLAPTSLNEDMVAEGLAVPYGQKG